MKRLLFVVTLLLLLGQAAPAQVMVIAHHAVPVTTLGARGLIDVYVLVQTSWSDGSPIRVFALKSGSESVRKFHEYLGRDPLQMRKLWLRAQLTGEGQAPTMVSEDEIVARIAETPGSIGYVDASKVTNRVKVLLQIGR